MNQASAQEVEEVRAPIENYLAERGTAVANEGVQIC